MNKYNILREVEESKFQPEYIPTKDINEAVLDIMTGHEDYELKELHNAVLNILKEETQYFAKETQINIDFTYACNLQNVLYKAKKTAIENYLNDNTKTEEQKKRIQSLPNQHINLGLRQKNVKVNDWTPPEPLQLLSLIDMCFPIMVIKKCCTDYFDDLENGKFLPDINTPLRNMSIQEWYKIFQTVHFFEDFNGRVGGIILNILSFLIHGHYLKYKTKI